MPTVLKTYLRILTELLKDKDLNEDDLKIWMKTPLHFIEMVDFSRRGRVDWTEDDSLSNFDFAFFKLSFYLRL